MNEKRFVTFLKELSTAVSLPGLRPDANGACLIYFKEKNVSLLFEYDETIAPNTILISSELATLSHEKFTLGIKETFKLNNLNEEAFSLKPNTHSLFLHRRVDPEIRADLLKATLDSFLSTYKNSKEKFSI